ncbi:MAG: hypothetical protein GX552_06140 [Chloroflexi bacterium]|jgi:hypothetical protein|nr:hypothetical protein [Chloroflexota bacterium]
MVLQRVIHKIRPGKWDEFQALEAQFDSVQAKLGIPPRKRYRRIYGKHSFYTEVIEREWPSLSVMEALASQYSRNAELRALQDQAIDLIECTQYELYQIL